MHKYSMYYELFALYKPALIRYNTANNCNKCED